MLVKWLVFKHILYADSRYTHTHTQYRYTYVYIYIVYIVSICNLSTLSLFFFCFPAHIRIPKDYKFILRYLLRNFTGWLSDGTIPQKNGWYLIIIKNAVIWWIYCFAWLTLCTEHNSWFYIFWRGTNWLNPNYERSLPLPPLTIFTHVPKWFISATLSEDTLESEAVSAAQTAQSALGDRKPKLSVGGAREPRSKPTALLPFTSGRSLKNVSTSHATQSCCSCSHPLVQDVRLFFHGFISTPSYSMIRFFSHPFWMVEITQLKCFREIIPICSLSRQLWMEPSLPLQTTEDNDLTKHLYPRTRHTS